MAEPEEVTDADIEAAEGALEQGRQRLEQLHDAFLRGVGEWQDYVDQKAVIEYAEAALIKLGRDKAKFEEGVRRGKLSALAEKADKFNPAPNAYDLAQAFEGALTQFVGAFLANNQEIEKMRQEAIDLGVPERRANRFPSAKDAYLEVAPQGVLSTRTREFQILRSGAYIQAIIGGVYQKLRNSHPDVDRSYFSTRDDLTMVPLEQTYEELRNLDQAASVQHGYFYRQAKWRTSNPNVSNPQYEVTPIPDGAVYSFPDELTREQQIQRQLVAITEDEARGDV